MNQSSLALGIWAVKDDAYFNETREKIIKTREEAKKRFIELGFNFPDSMANFVFVSHKSVPAKEIFEALMEEGIYVRYFDSPRIDNYLRITIGTDEEMDVLFNFLEKTQPRVSQFK